MKSLYRFMSETEIKKFNSDFVVVDNMIYTNPTEENIKAAGYKELAEIGEEPEYNPETQYLQVRYTDGDVITQEYEVIDIPEYDTEVE